MATPFERVKAAWASPDRDGELNRAVEVMAAEGVTRDELDTALGDLLLEIRAAGAADDTEEIINGVGDRLHGWCASRWHIRTPDDAGAVPPMTGGRPAPHTPTVAPDSV